MSRFDVILYRNGQGLYGGKLDPGIIAGGIVAVYVGNQAFDTKIADVLEHLRHHCATFDFDAFGFMEVKHNASKVIYRESLDAMRPEIDELGIMEGT